MNTKSLNSALLCARYAFAPNYYHYCGPDTKGEFGQYLKEEEADRRLVEHLTRFEVLYPYLKAIAQANGIDDPLHPAVIEAYWIGNSLLERVSEQDVFVALTDKQHLTKRLSKKELRWLLPKIDKNARLHHSFHVFNVFTRTGHHTVEHTVETMDECRISWGQLMRSKIKNQNAKVQLKSQKLIYEKGQLKLVPVVREVILPSEVMGERLKRGDFVSCHWGFVCDRITKDQVNRLKKYTLHHLNLANQTL